MLRQVADIFLSLLPARYRRRYQMDPVAGTIGSGIVQVVVAFVVYAALFFRYLQVYGALSGSIMASPAAAGRGLYSTSFGLGVIGWLAFSISPGPLLATYFMIEGTARTISGGITHEPLASLPFWALGEAHGFVERLLARRRLAPPAPDLVDLGQPEDEWDLRVTCVRPKPGWHSLVQVEYNGVHYSIAASGEEEVDGKLRFRYYLRKATGTEGFHGIVRYDPFDYWKTNK